MKIFKMQRFISLMMVCLIKFSFAQTDSTYSSPDTTKNDLIRLCAPKLFLDCSTCDQQYYRQEINYINFVRDRRLANVYVLVRTINTGSGGIEFTLEFIGQNEFKELNDTLQYVAPANQANAITREALRDKIKIGVLPYVIKTPLCEKLIYSIESEQKDMDVNQVKDKWNFWTFNISSNSWGNGNAYNTNLGTNVNLSANRVTEQLRTETGLFGFGNYQRFVVNNEIVTGLQLNWGGYHFTAKSIGKHWAAGHSATYFSSTVQNLRHSTSYYGTVEYNIFPYSEATRRQLRINYRLGGRYQDYYNKTIYNKNYSWFTLHSLVVSYNQVEKWGNIGLAMGGFHYLNYLKNYNLSINPSINWNPAKGLSIGLFGGFTLVNDQFFLSAEEISDSEVLLNQRALATNFNFWGGFNINYSFGSIYNSVVNVRFNLNDNFW